MATTRSSTPRPAAPPEVRTEAGKAMLLYLERAIVTTPERRSQYRGEVTAIEAEAARSERERVRLVVEALPTITMAYPPDDPVHRAAVLALLRDAP